MKNIFITGCSRGIGLELFRVLSENYNVWGSTTNPERFRKIIPEKNSQGIIEFDANWLGDISKINEFFNSFPAEIDVLINNAGTAKFGKFTDSEFPVLSELISVNLNYAYLLTRRVLPGMVERKSGMIVNILSVATKKAFTGSSLYSASKAALASMFDSVREEVRDSGVKITNLYLGATDTDIWSEKVRQKHSERMLRPQDVAETVAALVELSRNERLMVEELILRPQKGDL